jgi:hypothetical protein
MPSEGFGSLFRKASERFLIPSESFSYHRSELQVFMTITIASILPQTGPLHKCRWGDYSYAKDVMFQATDTKQV